MELNIIERLIIKIFWGTFDKIYKKGLSDTFNFIQTPSPAPYNIIIGE